MTTLRREFARQFERYRPNFVDDLDLDQFTGAPGVDPEILALRKAIEALPFKYREVLTLQVTGGYTGAEIAAMVELPRATVNTRLFRARQKLRKSLDESFLASDDDIDEEQGA